MAEEAFHRILLKLSGEALLGKEDYGIDPDIIHRLAVEINDVTKLGIQVAVVIGGGNIFRGAGLAESGIDRVTGDNMGMLATVVNSLALQDALESINVDARVMSAVSVHDVCEDYIRRRAVRHLEKGRVVKRTMFNFGQPDPGDIVKTLKPRRSPFISLNCEAHNFMFGFMMAPPHPYAVVVGEDGSYSIDDIPAGEYIVKAWHPRFGLKETTVTVAAGAAADADFTFKDE